MKTLGFVQICCSQWLPLHVQGEGGWRETVDAILYGN